MSHKLYCALSHEHTFFFVHTRSMYIGDFENWRMWYHGRDIDFDPDVMKAPTGLSPPLCPPPCTLPLLPSVCFSQCPNLSHACKQTGRVGLAEWPLSLPPSPIPLFRTHPHSGRVGLADVPLACLSVPVSLSLTHTYAQDELGWRNRQTASHGPLSMAMNTRSLFLSLLFPLFFLFCCLSLSLSLFLS